LKTFLRLMDPESVRRLGTVFIGAVASGLLTFTLLLVARLPWLGMPRWRWDVQIGSEFILPLGAIIYTVGLVFIIGYWYYCHSTFRTLIRRVKDSKLQRLSIERQNAIKELAAKKGNGASAAIEADRFEKLRKRCTQGPGRALHRARHAAHLGLPGLLV
jgi:hypothetical protein